MLVTKRSSSSKAVGFTIPNTYGIYGSCGVFYLKREEERKEKIQNFAILRPKTFVTNITRTAN